MWLGSRDERREILMISGECRVLIAGGGTAGHVIPAVAIGKALYSKGLLTKENEIHFINTCIAKKFLMKEFSLVWLLITRMIYGMWNIIMAMKKILMSLN